MRHISNRKCYKARVYTLSHLAVGGGKGNLETGADDDHDGRAEFDRETARGGDLGDLHTDGSDDLVTVEGQADHDTNTTEGEDPEGVVSEFTLTRDLAGGINHIDGSEGAHGVGDVVGAVREGIAYGGEDLHVLEGLLGARVEFLGIVVDGGHVLGVLDASVDVLVHLALHKTDDATVLFRGIVVLHFGGDLQQRFRLIPRVRPGQGGKIDTYEIEN